MRATIAAEIPLAPAFDDFSDWQYSGAFSPRYIPISRGWLVNGQIDWDEVDNRIERAVDWGADWVYVDDALSATYWSGKSDWGTVSVATMQEFCHRVHQAGKLAAVADMDAAMTNYSSFVGFYDSVDVIMPYGYNRSLTTLSDYFYWVRSSFSSKKVIPYLGYHVWDPDTNQWKYQLGSGGNNTAFIETAMQYSTEDLVFYYIEPDSWNYAFEYNGGVGQRGQQYYLDALSTYLAQYEYLPENDY